MKIDGNRGTQDAQATDGARRTEGDAATRRTAKAATTTGGDRVEVSGDAALLAAALKAANSAPDVRADVVERMREKLAQGRVGKDSGALADAILDDLLK